MIFSSFFLLYAFQQFVHRAAVNEIERVLDEKLTCEQQKGLALGPA